MYSKKSFKIILSIIVITVSFSFVSSRFTNVKRVSVSMISRSIRYGKTMTMRAEICYNLSGGKMVSHYSEPIEQYILNTSKGEISIYSPEKNTVQQQVNYLYSTETTQFYYFLNNQKTDLGLRGMGFINKNTKFEKDLMISTWLPPTRVAKQIKEIELVHQGLNPIYTKYIGAGGNVIKKIYYYQYQNVGGIDFPLAVTQIDYFSTKDSVISKTSYTDVKINEAVNSKLANFVIPSNAKTLK